MAHKKEHKLVMSIIIEINATSTNSDPELDKKKYEKPITITAGRSSRHLAYARVEKFERQEIAEGNYSVKEFLKLADSELQINVRYAIRNKRNRTVIIVPYGMISRYSNSLYEVVVTNIMR